MKISAGEKRPDRKFNVVSVWHEKLLFNPEIVIQFEKPRWPWPMLKRFYSGYSIRIHDIRKVSLRRKEPIAKNRLHPGLEPVHENLPIGRRSRRRQQQRMVTSRSNSRSCAACKSAKPAHFKPFGRI